MLARRSNRAVWMAAWVTATCGLSLGSAACTDGTTADCSDAQCQAVVEVIDTGAGADSGVDADTSSGPDADSTADADSSAGVDADSSAPPDAADGARE